MMNLLNFKLFY